MQRFTSRSCRIRDLWPKPAAQCTGIIIYSTGKFSMMGVSEREDRSTNTAASWPLRMEKWECTTPPVGQRAAPMYTTHVRPANVGNHDALDCACAYILFDAASSVHASVRLRRVFANTAIVSLQFTGCNAVSVLMYPHTS